MSAVAIPAPRRAVLHHRLPAGMAGREVLVTLAHPRAVVVRTLVPLTLAVPLTVGGAPPFWAAMLLTVLVAMVGAVGTGMALARARASGLLARLAVVPGHPIRVAGAWLVACAAVDLLQLAPALAVVGMAGGGGIALLPPLLLAAATVVILANLLGAAASMLAGGAGEVLLDVAVVLAPLLFLAGVFTGVPRTGVRAVVARVDPLSALDSALSAALGGSPAYDSPAVAAAAGVWLIVAALLLVPLSSALLRSR